MRDIGRRRATVLALVAALVLLVALPGASLASPGRDRPIDTITIADVPAGGGEDCVDDPDLHPGTGLRECPKVFDAFSLAPFVAGSVLVLLALVVGWYLVMRRRASRPFLPDEALAGAGAAGRARGHGSVAGAVSSEWWTCRSCGSTNKIGSARCYKCGAWQR
jgi:hypothetical protein